MVASPGYHLKSALMASSLPGCRAVTLSEGWWGPGDQGGDGERDWLSLHSHSAQQAPGGYNPENPY